MSLIGRALGIPDPGPADRRPRVSIRPSLEESDRLDVKMVLDLRNPLSVRGFLRFLRSQGIGARDLESGGELLPALDMLWRDSLRGRDGSKARE